MLAPDYDPERQLPAVGRDDVPPVAVKMMWRCLRSAVRSRRRRRRLYAPPPDHRACRWLGLRLRPAAAVHVASPALGGADPTQRPKVPELVAFFAAHEAAAAAEEDSQNTGGWGDFESYSTLGSQSATGGPSHCAVGDTSDSWADSQPPFDSSLHTDSESWSQ